MNRDGLVSDVRRFGLTATGGSLVVCLATPAALYVAADSRYAKAPLAIRDSARKLLVYGRTALCGLCGLLRFTRTEFDFAGDALRQTTLELAEVIGGLEPLGMDWKSSSAERFAESLHAALAPVWATFTGGLDSPFGSSRELVQILYANRSAAGEVCVDGIDLKHSMRRSESGEYSSVLEAPVVRTIFHGTVHAQRLFIRGSKRCVSTAALGGKVDDDAAAVEAIDGVFRVSRREMRCAKAIGGPVDVAVIDSSGRRWLRRKPVRELGRDQLQ